MSTVARKPLARSSKPVFYGRGVSLDGPRGTIEPRDRADYDRDVKDLIGRISRIGTAIAPGVGSAGPKHSAAR